MSISPPPRKRPRSESTLESEDGPLAVGRYTLESIRTYLTSLRAIPVDLETFSDPSKCASLLFPSLLKSSIHFLAAPSGEYTLHHMGRSIFSTIWSQVEQLDRQIPSSIALVGTYGSGKSHLLSALASFLFAQGKRVVFLPECPLVAEDPIFWLKLAFALPFADLSDTIQRILQFKTIDEFVEFTRGSREDIYFLVDGLDQLQPDFKAYISTLTSSQLFIYSTYALDTHSPTMRRALPIRIPSGLSPSELTHWLHHFQSQLPTDMNGIYRAFIETYTGSIPSLLLRLFDFCGQVFCEALTKYRASREFHTLADNIVEFHTAVEKLDPVQKSRYHSLMRACFTETIPEIRFGANAALYDPRYFYFDSDGKGHCVCGLVRDILTPLLRMDDLDMFTTDAWYSAVRSGSPRIRDFSIAQICLSRIGMGGLTQADTQGNAMRICAFRQNPNFVWMFEEAWKNPRGMSSFLCMPGHEVCPMLNAVIMRINPSDRTAQLIPLQITSAQTCIDVAGLFFTVTWHRWETAILQEGFKVVNTFVAIDNLTPECAEIAAKSAKLRQSAQLLSPNYSVRNLNAGQIDPKLGRILQGDKLSSPPL
ncbi:hypothetical protein C8F04DRAFT_220912 [Mycena alexandri]|uniref:Uncharacterized protein n=1 Tax=Mycena alexandri TaxID=1745969 RepID=A0AAD6TMZ8_9AGAR|nr:hypothetical protein C8F04DRAFT_220912 [Mycena alexandri]